MASGDNQHVLRVVTKLGNLHISSLHCFVISVFGALPVAHAETQNAERDFKEMSLARVSQISSISSLLSLVNFSSAAEPLGHSATGCCSPFQQWMAVKAILSHVDSIPRSKPPQVFYELDERVSRCHIGVWFVKKGTGEDE